MALGEGGCGHVQPEALGAPVWWREILEALPVCTDPAYLVLGHRFRISKDSMLIQSVCFPCQGILSAQVLSQAILQPSRE